MTPPAPPARLDSTLLMTLTAGIALQAMHLPPWIWLILAAALVWRAGAQWQNWRLPSAAWLITLAVLSGFGVFFDYHSLWGRDAGVAFLTLTAAFKLLEARQLRDQRVLLLMGFFLSISLLLFDQGMLTALAVLALFFGLLTAWLGIESPGISWRDRSRFAGYLLLLALPVALILFLLFPRPPGGLWGVQQPVSAQARTGLSDTLSAGSFDALSKDPTPAFRVQFDGEIPPPPARYWRVLVMSQIHDGVWQANLPSFSRPPPSRVGKILGDTVRYTLTLEPSDRRFVPSLTLPRQAALPNSLLLDANGSLFSRTPIIDRRLITLESGLNYRLNPSLSTTARRENLQLPADNPRLKALGKKWQTLSPEAARDAALDYFHTQGFRYTLSPGRLQGENRMDQFLFDTRRGYCEHYAEAFTLLMRAAGVPARIVTGYQGGEVVGDYLLVRQADAHAWSEIWIAHQGWVRVDPTTAVAPERIDTGLAQAAIEDAALPAVLRGGSSLTRRLALTVDQIQNGWNQYVLAYSGETQRDLLRNLGLGTLSRWQQVAVMLLLIAGTVWLVLRWWQRLAIQRPRDAIERAWHPLERVLTRLHLTRQAGESWQTYFDRISQHLPPALARDLANLAQQFSRWRYAQHTSQRRQKLIQLQAAALAKKIWRARQKIQSTRENKPGQSRLNEGQSSR
ncbi:transglutaminaseTgpA domain-containing protein [Halothiobacillus sp. DCM-1]|uniref:transglutaminase family protein n=1 Tax=Halothiobacillus sp. DCM-1 TaxID=3112558 RepID=UPI00325530B5